MRLPIKLNPSFFNIKVLSASEDPLPLCKRLNLNRGDISALSAILLNGTFKTTSHGRFPMSLKLLKETVGTNKLRVLDVGASCGISSVSLIEHLEISLLMLTDIQFEVEMTSTRYGYFLHNADGSIAMWINKIFIVYFNTSVTKFFGKYLSKILLKTPRHMLPLFLKQLSNDKRCRFEEHDWLEPLETNQKFDLILVSNLLNKAYFKDNEIQTIFANALKTAADECYILVIDNRMCEQSTLFQKSRNGLKIISCIGSGTEVTSLLLETKDD